MPLTIAIVGEEPCLRSSQVKDLLHYYLLEYYDGVVSLNSALKETVPDVIVSDETIFDKTIEVLDRMTTGDYSRKPVCVCICRRQKQGRPIASSDNSLFHPLGNGSPPLRQTIDQALIRKITEDMTTDREEGSFRIVGSSQSLRRQIALTQKSAVYDEPVLITGDTGTGKELFARYLHLYSRRHSQPYHVVNCSAISNDLFESELFGHKKGAFTGALADSDGLFRLAHHGTLVLDEISEIEPRFQVKLLRAIENQEILSVGGQIAEKINTRVVALSNRDLWREMERGTFRPDLFHRLNKFHIHLPTLKEREDDYEELFFHFLEQTWFSRLEKWK
ncbi:MAG: hypothetical protein CL946_12855, partial [Ectothiorhodospiraceae bacterium]|nr:hypothetical protein [Ectothiorhodospiraceae bacterium]